MNVVPKPGALFRGRRKRPELYFAGRLVSREMQCEHKVALFVGDVEPPRCAALPELPTGVPKDFAREPDGFDPRRV